MPTIRKITQFNDLTIPKPYQLAEVEKFDKDVVLNQTNVRDLITKLEVPTKNEMMLDTFNTVQLWEILNKKGFWKIYSYPKK